MKIWKKIKEFVDKTYTDRKTGELFLSLVLSLGGVGVFFCLVWFALLCMEGIAWWLLAFDIAIILFCVWAVVKGIIPMAKEAFKRLENLE